MIAVYKEDEKNLLLNVDIREGSLANADQFKAELIKLFEAHPKRLIVNLQKVEYIDSSFLGALVSALRQVIAAKQDIILVGLRKDIAGMFALIRLDKVFKIHNTFDEALAN